MPYKRLIALLLALAAITGLVACGGGNETTSTSEGGSATTTAEAVPTTIVVHDEEPVNGVEKLEYNAGEQVEFKVESDLGHGGPRSRLRNREGRPGRWVGHGLVPGRTRRHLRGRGRAG